MKRLIREKLPKKARIDQISQDRIEEFMDELNRRPMKVLGFLSPKEAFLQERFLRGNL
jgi:IS30 family transposase